MYSRVGFLYHQEREKEKERERESPKALCSVPVCSLRFFSFLFFPSFFSFVCWMFLEEDGRICQRYFSLFFFFFFFFKSLLFPHKRKRAAAHYYYPKKSFEANGARGRLDEEGSLNDTAGGLSRLLRRRRRLFFFRGGVLKAFWKGSRVLYIQFSGDHARTFGEK